MTGSALYNLMLPHIGEAYVFGALPKNTQEDYAGPWDCAAFTSYAVYQLTGQGYGFDDNTPKNWDKADAYTGFYARDAVALGIKITVEEAARTKGAFLLRVPKKGAIGHIAISDGKGGTLEAHSTKQGVKKSVIAGRNWDYGILVPWISYERSAPVSVKPVLGKIYAWTTPLQPKSEQVKTIQRALGFTGKDVDGWYGEKTHLAVVDLQKKKGLIADGQMQAGGETAAALKLSL